MLLSKYWNIFIFPYTRLDSGLEQFRKYRDYIINGLNQLTVQDWIGIVGFCIAEHIQSNQNISNQDCYL